MNRRDFNKVLGMMTLAAGVGSLNKISSVPANAKAKPEVAVTMDDFSW
jgi:hypothetical protein